MPVYMRNVSMKLSMFEQYVKQEILSKGYTYFRNHIVIHLKKIGTSFTAKVDGNKVYFVRDSKTQKLEGPTYEV